MNTSVRAHKCSDLSSWGQSRTVLPCEPLEFIPPSKLRNLIPQISAHPLQPIRSVRDAQGITGIRWVHAMWRFPLPRGGTLPCACPITFPGQIHGYLHALLRYLLDYIHVPQMYLDKYPYHCNSLNNVQVLCTYQYLLMYLCCTLLYLRTFSTSLYLSFVPCTTLPCNAPLHYTQVPQCLSVTFVVVLVKHPTMHK